MKNKLIITSLVILSLTTLLMSKFNNKDILLLINNEAVLTSDNFYKEAKINYLNNIANNYIREYIIKNESKNIDYNNSEIENIQKKYSYINDQDLIYTYYFFEKNFEKINIQEFFKDKYGLTELEIYEISSYEDNNHDELENIRTYLEQNGIFKTETEFDIEFHESYMFDLSPFDDTYDSNSNLSREFLNKSYHIMNDKSMELVYINKIISYKDNPDIFKDLYFLNNYSTIKNNILNELRNNYIVEVKQQIIIYFTFLF